MFRYVGGKGKIHRQVIRVILLYSNEDQQEYVEPFVGAGNTILEMKKRSPKKICRGFDNNSELIVTLVALQNGSLLRDLPKPKDLDEKLYTILRYGSPSPTKFFIGHACGYSGNMFRIGFDDHRTLHQYRTALLKAKKEIDTLQGISLATQDYKQTLAEIKDAPTIVYCDPPYKVEAVGYKPTLWKKFDHDEFWQIIREFQLNHMNSIVFVTEMSAPSDFVSIWHRTSKNGFTHKDRTEHLYIHRVKQVQMDLRKERKE